MLEWQTAFEDLKQRYVTQSKERLGEVKALLEETRKNPQDRKSLGEMRRHFHWLAGSGGIYGFSEATRCGKEAERRCDEILAQAGTIRASDLEPLKECIDAAVKVFEMPSGADWLDKLSLPDGSVGTSALIVGDKSQRLDVLANALREQDVAVFTCADAGACKTFIAQKMPDIIITDLPLDDRHCELIEKVRAIPAGEHIAILVAAGKAEFMERMKAINAGADAFFEDPIDCADILDKVRFILERSEPESHRILYVEDDPSQAEFVLMVLSTVGYHVQICSDPATFETDVLTHRPDLILLDINLPDGVNGYQLARYIRQQDAHATVPIVFLTTESRVDSKVSAARSGADDFLMKPVPPSLLLSMVAAKLERSRLLKSLLYRDGLTRLLTHTAFMSEAQKMIAKKRRRPDKSIGMALLDIDHFKSINDKYGHPVGDKVIVSLSNLLRRKLRRTDLVGRYGGEEFIMILEDLCQPDVQMLVERLLMQFSSISQKSEDEAFKVTFSAGVAMLEASMELPEWVEMADNALLEAKRTGRNRVVRSQANSVA